MSVRLAKARDAPAIAVIWNRIIRETLATFTTVEKDADALAETIRTEPKRWCVATVKSVVVGFACYSQFRGGPGYAHSMEYTVHLAEAARQRGLGRALLTAIERAAKAEGAHSLYGGVSGANPEGLAFHAKTGFTLLAILPEVGRKKDQWIDLHLYQKFL